VTALRPNPDVISKRLDSGAVLVHIPTSRIFELNETGTLVWDLIGAGSTPAQITSQLVKSFEVDEVQAADEVTSLVEQLRAEGLLA